MERQDLTPLRGDDASPIHNVQKLHLRMLSIPFLLVASRYAMGPNPHWVHDSLRVIGGCSRFGMSGWTLAHSYQTEKQ